jgi:hypothetical protein
MYKYLLFAYNIRFGGKGGLNDLTLKFNSFDEVKLKEIEMPLDPMYAYKYQLVNTEDFSLNEFISKSGYDREGEDRKQITRDRIKEVSMWLVEAVVSNEKKQISN